MKKRLLILLALVVISSSCEQQKLKVLVFSKTVEFRHGSINVGKSTLMQLGLTHGFEVDTTENAARFTEENLKKYAAVVFLNTTGDVLNSVQQSHFERYIQAGGGFVGVHAATDTEYDWPWYAKLVGANFVVHPKIQEANLQVLNQTHPATKHLPEIWRRKDEWYNFTKINPAIEVLINLDESSYEGGQNGENHPISWIQNYDGGRVFYTGLGHIDEAYADTDFQQHLLGGLQYAMGDGVLDYGKATTEALPEENRFVKTILDFNLDEPMELDELPGKGILFAERRGNLKLYDFDFGKSIAIGKLDVFYGNEDGLLGIAVDPNYEKNHWIYVFYSPQGEIPKQQVSRFTLTDDTLDLRSEKILITIPTIRECCHSGGALEFGPDGHLFIATGDNTNPFESAGFAPIDERPNRALWDAQKSAANTNDLRGKILRIKPEDDGTYSIPEGNLFPKGTPKTRPEIYIMGLRNPFRFSIDSKTKFVYWGDVGPDAGKGRENRGPKGMGEFNQARQAGFWGWPYTRGNNQAYNDFDFSTNTSGKKFDPANLINNSPHNTGMEHLPPAQESQLWYSYDESEEFPWLGTGGVNPMAGPVFHKADYPKATRTFPTYFENKLLVYEWMRDWIYVVTLDDDYNYVTAEPFMPHTEFSHPMDMIFGSDGALYLLEYGQSWNTRNLDARLSQITYVSGNRSPIARAAADKIIGATPLTVQFTAASSEDYDDDALTYEWSFNDQVQSTEMAPSFTFDEVGTYAVRLRVTDSKGASSESTVQIKAGNDAPKVNITLKNPIEYYREGKSFSYEISVTDAQDGSTTQGDIAAEDVQVKFTFIPEGQDRVQQTQGHLAHIDAPGKILIDGADCKACHAIDKKVNGPSYQDIATKYNANDMDYLSKKILEGGSGVWGEAMMAPHPTLSDVDARKIVDYILSLKQNEDLKKSSLGMTGVLRFDQHKPNQQGVYVLAATYKDSGTKGLENAEISTTAEYVFNSPRMNAQQGNRINRGAGNWEAEGLDLVGSLKNGSYLMFEELPLASLSSIDLNVFYIANYNYGGSVEFREGSPTGPLLGSTTLGYFHQTKSTRKTHKINIDTTLEQGALYVVFTNKKDKDQFIANAHELILHFK